MMLTGSQMGDLRKAFLRDWIQSAENIARWAERAVSAAALDDCPNRNAEEAERIHGIADAMRENGSWPGIDYASQLRENWDAVRHFTHGLHPLIFAFLAPRSSFRNDHALQQKIVHGIDFWLRQDFQNPNWWYQVNGLPAYFLGPALVAMEPWLSDTQRAKGSAILERSNVKRSALWRGGGNGLYDCRAALTLGLFENNAALVGHLYDLNLARCLCMKDGDGDGVNEDYSHWEHGHLLFNHGYGAALLQEGGCLLWYAREAGLGVSGEMLDFLSRYLLDGSRWMARGANFCDPAALGRSIAVPRQEDSPRLAASYLAVSARYLLLAGAKRRDEMEALIADAARETSTLDGNRMFTVSDYMTHQRPGFYASVRMFSRRTLNTEICNGVNRLGHHLGEGSLYLVRRGDEYDNLFPCWDWNKVPGTTVNVEATANVGLDEIADSGWLPCRDPDAEEAYGRERLRVGRLGRTTFVGGVSDGQHGAACMDVAIRTLRARKAWFFLGDEFFCLGAAITDTEPGMVQTTINQCRLNGPVRIRDADGQEFVLPAASRRHAVENAVLVHHDDTAYLFPQPQTVVCSNAMQSGDWHRINLNLPDTPVEKEVFSLWIEHGSQPRDAAYAVRILPGIRFEDVTAACIPAEILQNSGAAQAIRSAEQVAVAFYEPGCLQMEAPAAPTTLSVDAPCIALLDQASGLLTIADPTQTQEVLRVAVGERRYAVSVSRGRPISVNLADPPRSVAASPRAEKNAAVAPAPVDWSLLSAGLSARASSSLPDHLPVCVGDGSSATCWMSEETGPQWIEVDLDRNRDVRTVHLDWSVPARDYELQVSGDGVYFNPLVRVREYQDTGGVDYPGLFVTCRYVRVLCSAPAFGKRYALTELAVYGVGDAQAIN